MTTQPLDHDPHVGWRQLGCRLADLHSRASSSRYARDAYAALLEWVRDETDRLLAEMAEPQEGEANG